MTLAILNLSGNTPLENDSFIRITNGDAIAELKILSKSVEILKGPTDFSVCSWDVISLTSISSVGGQRRIHCCDDQDNQGEIFLFKGFYYPKYLQRLQSNG